MESSNSLSEQEHIAIMAHRIYVEEGRQEGKAAEHWARAERVVREQRMPVPDRAGASAEASESPGEAAS
jgi:hypothetical protein